MENRKHLRYAAWSATAVFTIALLWLTFRFLLPAALPLLFALLISSAVRPLARLIGKKSKTSVRISGAVIITLSVFALVYVTFCLGTKLFHEMTSLLSATLSDLEGEDNVIRQTVDFFKSLPERLPFLSSLDKSNDPELYDEIYDIVISAVKEAASHLSTGAASFAAGFIKGLPSLAFAVIVSIISLFYLTVDYDGVLEGAKRLLPTSTHGRVSRVVTGLAGALSGYARAYMVLMLLTFAELLFGFVIIGVKYAFFLAFLTAVIDVLPVLGSGCVLIPWSVVLLIRGDSRKGLGMLILFGVMYVVRQLTEPRLIGRFMGLHPLITLFTAYMGYRFFGIGGMISAPIVLYTVKLILSHAEDEYHAC